MLKTAAITALAAALAAAPVAAGSLKWEHEVDSDVRFKMVHDSGLIVVGTSQPIYGFNPETGAEKVEDREGDQELRPGVGAAGDRLALSGLRLQVGHDGHQPRRALSRSPAAASSRSGAAPSRRRRAR